MKRSNEYLSQLLVVLIFIVVTGLIAIQFGNPNFVDRAIALELSFITLSVLLWRGYSSFVYYPIAILVIIGNSLAPPHVNLMMTFLNL
ncbi:hypothetical protein [Candidatus Nitrosocosmicus sp. FF01]|uniref:hypothetical protein n=1 Tax=Candidatus Nitrosocosmicus sp. FF01 TaxID=3397670 RepID=UPI0039EBBA8D